ncbi:M15 family metallopeptidase [Curtobacterium citreum]|uniref:M15 family metallopeptidase n=1 Tax=Curtobacterium citreum TaxID=2036 RepID=UPI002543380D|nr:M15 family metallopeptidase [Curtobacterium citreum]WIJ46182.1 M15 family metallopeptidase [Curtobacterium citreum]
MPEGDPRTIGVSRATAAGAWGGYSNGEIPLSAMTPVPAANGQPYLRPDAAVAYFAVSTAFQARFGKALPITEAYRDLARQQALYAAYQAGGNLAATPGTSNHGWGLACDFGGGVNSYGSAEKNWMNANGPSYGWQPRGDSFSQREAWHFEYDGSYNPGNGSNDDGDDDVFKPRLVRIVDTGAPNGMNGLVAFFFPDRVVRTQNEAQINSLGRAWGLLKPGQKWTDVVDNLVYGEYAAGETEINSSRTTTRTEYVNAIVAALK